MYYSLLDYSAKSTYYRKKLAQMCELLISSKCLMSICCRYFKLQKKGSCKWV